MSDESKPAPGGLLNGLETQKTRRVNEAARSLHPSAVKDLLSLGVCERCILRLVTVTATFDSDLATVSSSTLRGWLGSGVEEAASPEPSICIVCLGVLQFVFSDAKQTLVKSDHVAWITDLVKQQGHEFDSFVLEVSLPSTISENERAVLLYLKGKYSDEAWLQSEKVSVKDALKVLVLDPLRASLGAKSDSSSFHIRLTYSQASDEAQGLSETKHERKKRKTDFSSAIFRVFYADEENGSNCMSENPFKKVSEPCILSVHCNKMPIFFGGRYFKYSRNVSQSRWIIDDERMGEASVEEIIGGSILPACLGDSYKFHAAGREDIDVRMLGSGRPFLIEVQNSRKCPSQQSLTEIEEKINNSEKKLVGVKDLKFIGSECWAMMREGEAEKQKQYAALVWISRPLEEEDCNSVSSMKELKILQKTPIRVLHRRSQLERERTIHWMKVEKIKGNAHYFLLHLCTQAGTYIKEFVHGDLGRTTPSMGSILGCRAEIIQLDVTDVKMGDS
ncbi:PREDICTED: putative tRNA pseudouridine synthase Pus10 isoform X2 [Brassica oleracea var. oleracea]|uniref:putative tRNA pseudouridine synthase Pus10 isoform X2 n=1 Tax=Brassica oleracea var. oleracea TaxID=109376 RepID=UPI0006A6EF1C|nr:PREDICTED: putative tRNA pseudouridine synthase Pus10 isoform X2 [Brassica oleracea var. oleracea]